jgi:hypothetical protein
MIMERGRVLLLLAFSPVIVFVKELTRGAVVKDGG